MLNLQAIPLVIVEGFLGGSGSVLWGKFEQHLNAERAIRPTYFARVGPVSSLHDRACELFYSVRGGRVDYGAAHAAQHNHGRYGRVVAEGIYPRWSRDNPLHFLGHSMGGPTIIKLQHLLSIGHFGPQEHPDMVLSVNTISAPFRGTQVVYSLGERVDAAPAVRPLSVGSVLTKGVHLLSFVSPLVMAVSPSLGQLLDLHTESRALTYQHSSLWDLLQQLWRSDWAEGRDATPFDVTFESADEREAEMEGVVHPNTYYRSHAACMTQLTNLNPNQHSPLTRDMIINPPLYLTSRIMGAFDFSSLRPIPGFLVNSHSPPHPTGSSPDLEKGHHASHVPLSGEYYSNDGIVPSFSQWHPLSCSATQCRHHEPSDSCIIDGQKQDVRPGIWNVVQMDAAHHMSVVPLWLGTSRQRDFWEKFGLWLASIDSDFQNTTRTELL